MFISFVLILVKRTKEKIKASTKFAKILRKNAKNGWTRFAHTISFS
ncbi:MAG: hypothetical protein J7K51_03955 [Thermotogae bacterium]|nr:hypothetical protein [Thermotogota bacterium]